MEIYLARHGETEWTKTKQHTGLTDIPLTEEGEHNAERLGGRLRGIPFAKVFTSPLIRARQTCALAGFGSVAQPDADLVEWDYGKYEGVTSSEIRKTDPTWNLFLDGGPDGESPSQITARADRVIANIKGEAGNVLLFSHGHFLRVLAARWLGVPVVFGRDLYLGTAAVSILGYEHGDKDEVIRLWNDCRHTEESHEGTAMTFRTE